MIVLSGEEYTEENAEELIRHLVKVYECSVEIQHYRNYGDWTEEVPMDDDYYECELNTDDFAVKVRAKTFWLALRTAVVAWKDHSWMQK